MEEEMLLEQVKFNCSSYSFHSTGLITFSKFLQDTRAIWRRGGGSLSHSDAMVSTSKNFLSFVVNKLNNISYGLTHKATFVSSLIQ